MNVQGASKCLGQSDMFAMQSRFHNLREGNYRYSESITYLSLLMESMKTFRISKVKLEPVVFSYWPDVIGCSVSV